MKKGIIILVFSCINIFEIYSFQEKGDAFSNIKHQCKNSELVKELEILIQFTNEEKTAMQYIKLCKTFGSKKAGLMYLKSIRTINSTIIKNRKTIVKTLAKPKFDYEREKHKCKNKELTFILDEYARLKNSYVLCLEYIKLCIGSKQKYTNELIKTFRKEIKIANFKMKKKPPILQYIKILKDKAVRKKDLEFLSLLSKYEKSTKNIDAIRYYILLENILIAEGLSNKKLEQIYWLKKQLAKAINQMILDTK